MSPPVNGPAGRKTGPRRPVYLAAADTLAERIADQPVGTRLPSEDELARDLGVSRLTARAVLSELESRYLVRRRQGSGTFVTRRIDYVISRHDPPSWSASVRHAGLTPEIRTTGWRLERPPTEVRARMRIGPRRYLLALSRDRFVDKELVGFADTWLDPDLVPDLTQVLQPGSSLHDTLASHYRLQPVRGWFGVALDPAPLDVAQHLGLTGRPPIIAIRSRTDAAARNQRPVEVTISWLRVDVFRVEVNLETNPG
jgi:GntR family transcriptional regulator